MSITYDPAKNAANLAKHGIAFDEAYGFEFQGCITRIDARKDYGEVRYIATGALHGRLHILCYVETSAGIRVISLRKANARERSAYEKAKKAASADQ